MDINNNNRSDYHQMGRRGHQKNYSWPGTYHITISVADGHRQPLGHIVGDVTKPDGDPQAPHVALSAIGQMVEQELTTSLSKFYPMVEVQDYVIMPDHLHCIIVVHSTIISKNGRPAHLGQVIAGFKKGCNRRYWELLGMAASEQAAWRGKPANAGNIPVAPPAAPSALAPAAPSAAASLDALYSRPAVYPHVSRPPSTASSGRPPLFAYGYVDVMPLEEGQLERQRQYIRNNPRSRLLRMSKRDTLTAQRGGIDTALTLSALRGYLQRECPPSQIDAEIWAHLSERLLVTDDGRCYVSGDSYGDRRLLTRRLLPVVCHRKDASLFAIQKARCLASAAEGAVLVSACIANGERDIIRTAIDAGYAVITIEDNGLSERYHPSEERIRPCNDGRLLIVSPWRYVYRSRNDNISVAECKTMNCVAQALCRQKDSWWKE